jgi:hypothetical protein
MGGAVLVFFGIFGRAFVLGPLFVGGMLLLTVGLSGVVLGYVGFESCGLSRFPVFLCPAYHPETFEPVIVLGAILIVGNTVPSGLVVCATNKRASAKFLGLVFVVLGAIISFFGWAVILTFVANYVSSTLFWIQIAVGLILIPAGIVLVAWSTKVRKPFPADLRQG